MRLTRRAAMVGAVSSTTAALGLAATMPARAQTSLAFTANDVVVETPDGTMEKILATPELEVVWEHASPVELRFDIAVGDGNSWTNVDTQTVGASDSSPWSGTLSQTALYDSDPDSDAPDISAFFANTEGGIVNSDRYVRITVTLLDASGNAITRDSDSNGFTVSVTNIDPDDPSSDVGGTANITVGYGEGGYGQ